MEQATTTSSTKEVSKAKREATGLLATNPRVNGLGTLKIKPIPKVRDIQPRRKIEPYVRKEPKIGRNQPCPCNSGRKYKKCCGNPATQK